MTRRHATTRARPVPKNVTRPHSNSVQPPRRPSHRRRRRHRRRGHHRRSGRWGHHHLRPGCSSRCLRCRHRHCRHRRHRPCGSSPAPLAFLSRCALLTAALTKISISKYFPPFFLLFLLLFLLFPLLHLPSNKKKNNIHKFWILIWFRLCLAIAWTVVDLRGFNRLIRCWLILFDFFFKANVFPLSSFSQLLRYS